MGVKDLWCPVGCEGAICKWNKVPMNFNCDTPSRGDVVCRFWGRSWLLWMTWPGLLTHLLCSHQAGRERARLSKGESG